MLIRLIGLFLALAIVAGCTKSPLAPNAPLFAFNPQEVTELSLISTDPSTGIQWSTRLQRSGTEVTDWQINAGPSDRRLADHEADGDLIFHLLDSLRALHLEEARADLPTQGPLDSFGLNPARWVVIWKSKDHGEQVLRIGNPVPKGEADEVYAFSPSQSARVLVLKGSAVRLFDTLGSFSDLRQKRWSAFLSDDVDEIEVSLPARSRLYAQRDGTVWTDRKHRPVKNNVSQLLEAVTHASIRSFLDEPGLSAPPWSGRASDYEVVLIDRHGKRETLRLKWEKSSASPRGRLLGFDTSRPGVFELDPQVTKYF